MADGSQETPTSEGDGDGDSDPNPTTTGDGDGDPTTTGDGDGDSTGDGDGDATTGNDACEDGDSGIEPLDDEDLAAPTDPDDPNDDEPHGGIGFVPDIDLPPATECSIWDQDCPDGEKCVPYASSGGGWDADKCVPVMGTGMVGDPCTYGGVVEATDDCDENSACWGIDNNAMGTCTAFCEGTPDAPICPDGSVCLQGNQGSIAFCVAGCNPISQDCADGEACYWANNDFNCASTTSDIPAGEPCGFINDCAEGLICLNAASVPGCTGSACCAEFCDLDCGGGTCSLAGTDCVAFFEGGQATPGNADVGICIGQ